MYLYQVRSMNEFQSVESNPEPLRPESRFMFAQVEPSSFLSYEDFWVWVGSDILNRRLSVGKVAEFIVGADTVGALLQTHPIRMSIWDTVDHSVTPEGITIRGQISSVHPVTVAPCPVAISAISSPNCEDISVES